MVMCLDARNRHTKIVSIYHSDTREMWKRFDNDVKRTTHVFEGIFKDLFDNDIPSDHPLNFASGIVKTSAIKSLRQRQSSNNKLHEEAFDTI